MRAHRVKVQLLENSDQLKAGVRGSVKPRAHVAKHVSASLMMCDSGTVAVTQQPSCSAVAAVLPTAIKRKYTGALSSLATLIVKDGRRLGDLSQTRSPTLLE